MTGPAWRLSGRAVPLRMRRHGLAALLLALFAWAGGNAAHGQQVLAGAPAAPPQRVPIPAGRYIPLYAEAESKAGQAPEPVVVRAFFLDRIAVTNAEFLEFVTAEPKWRRSRVARLFSDEGYLRHWADDLVPGGTAPGRTPVTNVSWFAAKAYCRWRGGRLPATDEWEYAAAASETAPPERAERAFRERVLQWYSRPAPPNPPPSGSGSRNLWGVQDLHGLIWEWTSDFNTALVTGESRQDSALERNLFCGSGAAGASATNDYAAFMRFGFRASLKGDYTVSSLGFRCAYAQDPP